MKIKKLLNTMLLGAFLFTGLAGCSTKLTPKTEKELFYETMKQDGSYVGAENFEDWPISTPKYRSDMCREYFFAYSDISTRNFFKNGYFDFADGSSHPYGHPNGEDGKLTDNRRVWRGLEQIAEYENWSKEKLIYYRNKLLSIAIKRLRASIANTLKEKNLSSYHEFCRIKGTSDRFCLTPIEVLLQQEKNYEKRVENGDPKCKIRDTI